jgi:hypothetical protein
MVKPFSSDQIRRAIDRLPQQSNASVKQVLENANRLGIEPLVQACQAELRVRGALNLSREAAEQWSQISSRIAGKDLSEVVEIAFREVPAKPEERLILKWIWQHPGGSHADLGGFYGGGELSLVIGHLIYYRFGYFRPMLTGLIQSDGTANNANNANRPVTAQAASRCPNRAASPLAGQFLTARIVWHRQGTSL